MNIQNQNQMIDKTAKKTRREIKIIPLPPGHRNNRFLNRINLILRLFDCPWIWCLDAFGAFRCTGISIRFVE